MAIQQRDICQNGHTTPIWGFLTLLFFNYIFKIWLQVIALSRRINPMSPKMTHVALFFWRIGAIVAMKVQMAPEPPAITGGNTGERWAHLSLTQWDRSTCNEISPHSSAMMIGEVISSSYHQYWWYEINPPPPYTRQLCRGVAVQHRSPKGTVAHWPPIINIGDRISASLISLILMIGYGSYLGLTYATICATFINLINEITPCPTGWADSSSSL